MLGPVVHYLNSLDAINTSNNRISQLVRGQLKDGLPSTGVYLWVDVLDVASAHVRAIEVPEAGGQRFFTVAGVYSLKDVADIIEESFPELADQLPKNRTSDVPDNVYGFDNTKSREVLGIQYRTLKQSIVDTVKSLVAIGA